MGHFTITLPDNTTGDVRWGTVRKIDKPFTRLFHPWKKHPNEKRKGYVVNINTASEQRKEYRLLKTTEGAWYNEKEGGFNLVEDEEVILSIKKAIDDYEQGSKVAG